MKIQHVLNYHRIVNQLDYFDCSIHCDRRLCLDHLEAVNVLYEEEKQYKAVLNKLQGD